jgi:phosphoenolpyruvate synthase/pyruvate phosphate dikinase
VHQGYDHRGVALSAGVQRMVRSDLASSGVMFSIESPGGQRPASVCGRRIRPGSPRPAPPSRPDPTPRGYDHRGVALSAGVQRMVRSDLASSGVMFSIDTESGYARDRRSRDR